MACPRAATFARGAGGDGFAQHGVDLNGEMRAVLLQRGDGKDDDGVLLGQVAQLVGAEFAPFGFGHGLIS